MQSAVHRRSRLCGGVPPQRKATDWSAERIVAELRVGVWVGVPGGWRLVRAQLSHLATLTAQRGTRAELAEAAAGRQLPACYVYFVSVGGRLVYLGSGKPERLRNYYSLSQDGVSRTGGSVICDAARTHSHQQDMFAELQKLGEPFTFELFAMQGDVQLPSSVPVEYSGDGEPHAACKAEHLILHEWDFAMNAAHNADYAWEELQDIWPLLGDVHSLPLCDSSSREASRANSRRTSMAGDVEGRAGRCAVRSTVMC